MRPLGATPHTRRGPEYQGEFWVKSCRQRSDRPASGPPQQADICGFYVRKPEVQRLGRSADRSPGMKKGPEVGDATGPLPAAQAGPGPVRATGAPSLQAHPC